MNLLGSLLNERKNAIFVAPNASFREVMVSQLSKEYDTNRIRHLIKGSSAFYASRKNTFDVIIVDEAHRLKNEKAFMYIWKNQVVNREGTRNAREILAELPQPWRHCGEWFLRKL